MNVSIDELIHMDLPLAFIRLVIAKKIQQNSHPGQ